MAPHARYASYIVRHKYFVLHAGLKLRVPFWRLLVHDWSKLLPGEWGPYTRNFYDREHATPGAFEVAWLRHLHRNPHHWQFWVLRNDDGSTSALPMPNPLIREMVADWMGAGRAITGEWDVGAWYAMNARRMVLAPETRRMVESLIGREE